MVHQTKVTIRANTFTEFNKMFNTEMNKYQNEKLNIINIQQLYERNEGNPYYFVAQYIVFYKNVE